MSLRYSDVDSPRAGHRNEYAANPTSLSASSRASSANAAGGTPNRTALISAARCWGGSHPTPSENPFLSVATPTETSTPPAISGATPVNRHPLPPPPHAQRPAPHPP